MTTQNATDFTEQEYNDYLDKKNAADRQVKKTKRALAKAKRELAAFNKSIALAQEVIITPLEEQLAIAKKKLADHDARVAQFQIDSKARMDALYATIASEKAAKKAERNSRI